MQFLSEIIFLLHDVGQTFVRNVEEINEGLYISSFKQVGTNTLPVVILVLLGRRSHVVDRLLEPLLVTELVYVVLPADLVEEDGRT